MVVLGIDFGTTFSSVCVYNQGSLHVFKQQNSAYIPTYLYLHSNGNEVSYGYDAEALSTDKTVKGGFFRDLKRWVGCDETNLEEYKSKLKPHYEVTLAKYGEGSRMIPRLGCFSGTDKLMVGVLSILIAQFLRALVSSAAEAFNCTCTGLIVSVPANYDCMQRAFTENCVNLSGYACVHMMNEPSAAALATCGKLKLGARNLLVYDFGGGTFDVSIISSRNQTFTVRASGGDMNLGGRDIDRDFRIELYRMAQLPIDEEFDVSSLKESLSKVDHPIRFAVKASDGRVAEVLVTADTLSKVMLPYVDRTVKVMRKVFDDYKRTMNLTGDFNKVSIVLVGGSSSLPGLKSLLTSVEFVSECVDLPDPRAAVAAGCALYSSCLSAQSPMLLVDCASHSLSIPDTVGESIVCVPAGAPIPFKGVRNVNLTGCTATATFAPILFEGDMVKCAYNKRVFSGEVALSILGVTSVNPSDVNITLETDVSSVGTVNFYIIGPSKRKVLVGGKPAYDFSKAAISPRTVADLHKTNYNRVLLFLSLTRTRDSRLALTQPEKEELDNTTEVKDFDKTVKHFRGYNEQSTKVCRVLLGQSVQKVLRGARVEELFF